MKRTKRIFLGLGCLVLLIASWAAALTAKTDAGKQAELMDLAGGLMEDGIYVRAVPLLEEAAGYETGETEQAEAQLKAVYLQLLDQSGYRRKYTALLEKQMARKGADSAPFQEAALYYLGVSKTKEALAVLRDGIGKTGDRGLTELYEANRYVYRLSRTSYDDVTAIYNGRIQIERDGLWGLAASDGSLLIPCAYDKVSTYSKGRAVVRKDGVISAVDGAGNRVALLHETATDFGNYAEDRIPLRTPEGWRRASGEFTLGTAVFEDFGMYQDGYAAARQGGRWGVVDSGNEWLIPAEYDGVVQDELGRCYAQEAVFVRRGDSVSLLVEGRALSGEYEDARPFADGYAAVKRGGRWGFIDTAGAVVIDFQFDDALSFGQHLAAVRLGEGWGYISRDGTVVIEPVFQRAKSFSNGSAPVQTEDGWQFITLLEYEEEVSL